jgi:putative membrane protein
MNDERDPIELSRRLVYLAAERTLTSWVRTALSLMALGFVIDRFGLILDLLPDAPANSATYSRMLSVWAGSAFIGLGVAMAFGAGVRYLRFAVAFQRERSTGVRHGIIVGVAFSLLLGFIGLGLIALLTVMLR